MSSGARICLRINESIESISVFSDGYPSNLGEQLLKMELSAVRQLMLVGNIRALVEGGVKDSYGEKSLRLNSISEVFACDRNAYFLYLYDGGEWYFRARNTRMLNLKNWLHSLSIADGVQINEK